MPSNVLLFSLVENNVIFMILGPLATWSATDWSGCLAAGGGTDLGRCSAAGDSSSSEKTGRRLEVRAPEFQGPAAPTTPGLQSTSLPITASPVIRQKQSASGG